MTSKAAGVALLLLVLAWMPANAQNYFNGFEVNTAGWDNDEGGPFDAIRVPSETMGIPSATGDWHATGFQPATNWGGFNSEFPAGGYLTSVDIYLDVDAGFANDRRLDFSSAINRPDGIHRRDFVFNLGFYNDNDGPGAGTGRFVVSASNIAGSCPKDPARSPIAIGTTGWYTFVHQFRDDGSGILEVEMSIFDADGIPVSSWVLSDATDIIGETVGGNAYGWFITNELGSNLAFDNSLKLSDSDGDGVTDGNDLCPDSDLREFVDVGSGPTSIPNASIGVDEFGCTIQDHVNDCAATAKNHGKYVSCVTKLANALYKDGIISKQQRQEMKTGAAKSSVGK